MTGCIDDNEASEFASGSLGKDAATRVETHLATCRDCRSLVAALAPGADEAEGDSDVITSPRRVAMGKRGKRGVDAIAPTELPRGAASTDPASPRARREDPVVVAGDQIGRYIILARLGAGGMGVVFTAYDPQLDRKVALKLLRNYLGLEEDEAHNRLVREAQAIAQLSHPNVVAVYDVGTADSGEVYIAMELVEGETLTSWLGHWDRSWREILELFFQAGRGLSAAHARGLMHRDFKPDNVLVGTDGRVRVTDFGLARSLIDQVDELVRDRPRPDLEALRVTLTATGTVLGTPRYMAPEQLRGVDADARSDQFSFCVALYEALYHRHPLPGDSVFEMVQHGAVADAPPTDSNVPAAIGKAILRGLSAEPSKRFPTLAALLVELTPPPVHTGRRGWVAALGGVALVAGGVAAAMVVQGDASTTRPDRAKDEQIIALQAEVEALRKQLNTALYADGGLADKNEKVVALQRELEEKEKQLEVLSQRVPIDAGPQILRPPRAPDAAPKPPPERGIPRAVFVAAVEARQAQVNSCMQEWMEREPDQSATLTVKLEVGPDGSVQRAPAGGMEDTVTPNCVSRAISRAEFPASDAITTAEIKVAVAGGAVLPLEITAFGSREAQTIDLGP